MLGHSPYPSVGSLLRPPMPASFPSFYPADDDGWHSGLAHPRIDSNVRLVRGRVLLANGIGTGSQGEAHMRIVQVIGEQMETK